MKPIYHLELQPFTKRDLVVCIADTVKEAADFAQKSVNLDMQPGDIGSSESLCITMPNGATALLFSRANLTAASICHLVTDATAGLLLHIGVELNQGSVCAYSYHNDMLFRLVVGLVKKHHIKIDLL